MASLSSTPNGQALARGEDVDALAAAAGVTVPATKKGPAAMCGTETDVPMYAACRNLIGSLQNEATTHCWRLVEDDPHKIHHIL